MISDDFLKTIKLRLGIYYSDPLKDMEVKQLIAEAQSFMKGAGWTDDRLEIPGAASIIVMYSKMAQQLDADAMRLNPMMIALLAQKAKGDEQLENEERTNTENTNKAI